LGSINHDESNSQWRFLLSGIPKPTPWTLPRTQSARPPKKRKEVSWDGFWEEKKLIHKKIIIQISTIRELILKFVSIGII